MLECGGWSRTRSGCEGESGFWSATEVRAGGLRLSCKCCTIRGEGARVCGLLNGASYTLLCYELWEKSPERRQKVSCLERLLHQDKLQSTVAGTRKSQDGLLSAFSRSLERGNQQGGCSEQKCGWWQSAVILRTR